jgi:lipopolysaccharide/colanic/teichoic acid biosynthesis glycosyltransferase
MIKFQKFFKKIMDFIGAIIGLIILSPIFLLIAILIKIDSRGPAFFRQERVGKDGKIFVIWKFRTMVENAEKIGLGYEIAKNDPRITRIGSFLRRVCLDEAPQLINILLDEMSLVGPRPALPPQVKKYTEFERRRLEVKPGLVNLDLLKGWNILPWKEKIKWDVWYLDHWSLWLDLKIIILTPFIVLTGRGQYGNGIVKDYE